MINFYEYHQDIQAMTGEIQECIAVMTIAKKTKIDIIEAIGEIMEKHKNISPKNILQRELNL